MTGILAMLLFIAVRSFLIGYDRYVVYQNKKTVLTCRANQLNRQQNKRKQKMHTVLRINRFVNNIKSLGLEKEKWAVYHVEIQDAVTFTEIKKILMQCSNAAFRYFKPVSFHMKYLKATENKGEMGNTRKISEMALKNKTGDILMTLKGAFVVRESK
jgi:hypothetical protein